MGLHFVAFVKDHGRLWELEGCESNALLFLLLSFLMHVNHSRKIGVEIEDDS